MKTAAPPTMTLCVASIMFDGDKVDLTALFELRAAGWEVEIEHSDAIPNWGIDPQVWFNARKELPDSGTGEGPDDKLQDEVWKEIAAFCERWGVFFDHIDFFKNPKPKDWRYHPWNDWPEDSDFWKNYNRT